jgi:hypothetical protein
MKRVTVKLATLCVASTLAVACASRAPVKSAAAAPAEQVAASGATADTAAQGAVANISGTQSASGNSAGKSPCVSSPTGQKEAGTASGQGATPCTVKISAFGYKRIVRDGEEYFCQRKEAETGSHMMGKTEVCLTKRDMERQRENGAEIVRRLQTNEVLPKTP